MNNKNVLILTATFGMGHRAVSKAIKDELSEAYIGHYIEIVDIFEILNPSLKEAFQKGYNVLTRDFEDLYNFFYHYKKNQKHNLIDGIIYMGYQKKFNQYIESFNPDIVISTFPMTSGFMSRYKTTFHRNIPLITVITDVVDSWEWLHDGTDRYFVPSKEVKDKLRLKGIPSYQIVVTGIPVRSDFKRNQKNQSETPRKNVLVMSSAMGKIKFDTSFFKELSQMDGVDFTIVTGTDHDLFDKIKHIQYDNIKIYGFVEDIASFMNNADLIYTKPGGVTLFEAINRELPLLVQDTAIGQESENIDFIRSRGIGMIVEAPEQFCQIIKEVLNDDLKLSALRKNMFMLKQEFDDQAIVRALRA